MEAAAYPYLVAPPGVGFGSGMSARAQAPASDKAAVPTAAAAAAAAAARSRARRRRRTTAKQLGRGYEYMDLEDDIGPGAAAEGQRVASTTASGQGAAALGLAGTAPTHAGIGAAGLTTLAGDEFGGGPRTPMTPSTWESDRTGDAAEESRDG